jgi:hypothetical protein
MPSCDSIIEESFLSLSPIKRIEHILNLKRAKLKSINLKLVKISEDDKIVSFSTTLPFDTLVDVNVVSYSDTKYDSIEVSYDRNDPTNKVAIVCAKSLTWNENMEVFMLSGYEPTQDIIVDIELYYLK